MGFDDYLKRANDELDARSAIDAPACGEPASRAIAADWEYKVVRADPKTRGTVMNRMSRRGWEYVDSQRKKLLEWGPAERLTFRRPR